MAKTEKLGDIEQTLLDIALNEFELRDYSEVRDELFFAIFLSYGKEWSRHLRQTNHRHRRWSLTINIRP